MNLKKQGFHKADSIKVAAKRVAGNPPIQFECEYMQTIRIPGTSEGKGTVDLIIGKVVEIHVADDIILPKWKAGLQETAFVEEEQVTGITG